MDNQQEDLKESIVIDGTGNGQPVEPETQEEPVPIETGESEAVAELKARLQKVEEERENYKQGMLSAKKEAKSLEPEKEEEDYPDWDETSKKFQKQTLAEAGKIAEKTTQQILEKSNENQAIAQFVAEHPGLEDESVWSDVISNYTPKHGKDSIKNITADLKRAYVLTKFEKGELSDLESKAFEKGKLKGKVDTKLADLSSVSTTTQKTVKEKSSLSEGSIILADRMRVDKAKLAAEDDSLSAEIKL